MTFTTTYATYLLSLYRITAIKEDSDDDDDEEDDRDEEEIEDDEILLIKWKQKIGKRLIDNKRVL